MPKNLILEISEIPKDWKVVRLGEIVETHDNKRIPLGEMERSKRKGCYPYCGANGIIDYIDDYIFDGEFVLLAEDGGDYRKFCKSAYIMKGKFWVNNHAHILQAIKGKTTNTFLLYLLNFLDLNPYIVGSTRKKLNQDKMKMIKIPLPLLPEQKKIAEILSTVDKAIQKVDEIIAKTKRLKKGLMQKLLTKGIGHDEFKYSEELGCEIPKEWGVVRLEEVCIKITDGSHFSPKEDENGEYKIATVANLKEKYIDLESCKRILREDFELLVKNGCKPETGDVLFSKDGTVGISFAFKQNIDIVLLSSIAIIRPKKEILNSDFCAYALKAPNIFWQITGRKTGTALRRIVLQDLKRIKIPLPPLQEQQKIAEIFSTMDKKLELEKKRKEKLEKIKKGLMNDLLTGRKRVKNLNLEDD